LDVESFLVKIKTIYPSLTKSEKEVANYISKNYSNIIFTSLNKFSEECGVGEATIFRFFKKLGFSGYHEFKNKMANQLRNSNKESKSPASESEVTYQNILQMLDDTQKLTDIKKLKQTALDIINSNSIYLFGVGFSGLSAQATQIRLMRLGYKSFVFSDQHAQIVSTHLMTDEDMAIAFSITGDTVPTINWLKKAKESRAKTLAITNHSHSDITKIASSNIFTAGKEVAQEGSTLITEMSQLYVIEQICNYLYKFDSENINKIKNKITLSIE